MRNGGLKGKRAPDGFGSISPQEQFVQKVFAVPSISSYAATDSNYIPYDDTAVTSGQTVVVYGTNFVSGMTVIVGTTTVSATLLDSGRLTFTAPALSNGSTYTLYVITPAGGAAVLSPGILFSGFPTWTTSAINNSGATVNAQLIATGDGTLSYSVAAGSSLPSGLTMSGTGLISGTATGVTTNSVYTFTIVVNDSQNQNTSQSITLNLTFNDPYFSYTTLLLNGVSAANTFINDASVNNSQLTIAGDTKPNNFNPYQEGYYSNYFDGTGDYLVGPSEARLITTGQFTIECWVNVPSNAAERLLLENAHWDIGQNGGFRVYLMSDGTVKLTASAGAYNTYPDVTASTLTVIPNIWTHIAITRDASDSIRIFINGVLANTPTTYAGTLSANTGSIGTFRVGILISDGGTYNPFTGYISNIRLINGTALYTANFTPPSSALTAVAGTTMLTCASSRLADASPNNFPITRTGDVFVSSATPFNRPITTTYNTQYSTYFDGTGDYLTIPSDTAFNLGAGDFTVEGWYNFHSVTIQGQQLFRFSGSSTFNPYMMLWDNGNIYFRSAETNGDIVTNFSSGMTIGTWYHWAVTRSGNTYTIYKNGVSVASGTSSAVANENKSVIIGTGLKGCISNFRVVKGVVVYTGTFTPPTSPLTITQSAGTNIAAITGTSTSLLTCQDSTLKDNSTNAFTITSAADAKPIAASPFTTTTATNTITSLGSTYFDGTGDYLSFPGVTIGTDAYTIECWFYISNFSTAYALLGTSNSNALDLRINNATTFAIDQQNVAQTTFTVPTMTPNTWYHVAFVRTAANQATVFLNGVQSSTGFVSITTNYNALSNYIGLIGSNYFPGYISDLRILKGTALYTSNFLPTQSPLTPVANTQLLTCQYNGGANNNGFVDQSSFNNIITRTGNATQGTFSPYSQTGWSNYFDGTGDYLQTPTSSTAAIIGGSGTLSSTSTFTIEGWIFQTTRQSYDYGCMVGDMGTNGSIYWGFGPNASGKLAFNWYDGATKSAVGDTTIALNTWTHIAVSISSGAIKLFVNGVLQTITGTSATTNASSSFGYLLIGLFYTGGTTYGYYGNISNLRITKTALYTTTFTPSTSPLDTVSSTGLLTCQSNRFIDNSPNNLVLTKNGDAAVQALSPFGSVKSTPISYSTYFDGTGDYLSASTGTIAIGTGDLTLECWAYRTSTTSLQSLVNLNAYNTGILIRWETTKVTIYVGGTDYSYSTPTDIPLNSWVHIALVRSGGVFKFYVNGTEATTFNSSYSLSVTSVTIGTSSHDTSDEFYGYISNVRLTRGVAVYTGNFTVPTNPLAATQGAGTNISAITGTQTYLLTCQSRTIIDNSPNYFTLTASGDTKPYQFNPFGSTASVSTEYSANANSGSMYCDTSGDYLSIPYNPVITQVRPYTLEFWFYPTYNYSGQYIFAQNGGGAFALNWTGTVMVVDKNGVGTQITGTTTLPLNAWAHYAMTYDGTTTRVWANGVLDGSVSGTGGLANVPSTIGYYTASGSSSYGGYLSDVRFTPGKALYTSNFYPGYAPLAPTTTIGANTYSAALLVNGTSAGITDSHGSVVVETVGTTQLGAITPYTGNTGGKSFYFGTKTDSLPIRSIPSIANLPGDFTIECWVNPTDASLSTTWGVLDARSAGASASAWLICLASYSSGWVMNLYNGTSYSGTTRIQANTWTHCAWVRSGSTLTFYTNGTAGGTATVSGAITGGTTTVVVGSKDNGLSGYGTVGYIKDLRITNGVARYTGTFTPPTITPIAY